MKWKVVEAQLLPSPYLTENISHVISIVIYMNLLSICVY